MSFVTVFLTNVSFYRRALTETRREARAVRTGREPAAPEPTRPQPLSPGESMVFWGAWRGLGMPLLLTQLPRESAEPSDESCDRPPA